MIWIYAACAFLGLAMLSWGWAAIWRDGQITDPDAIARKADEILAVAHKQRKD